MNITHDMEREMSLELQSGRHGSFAASLGEAYQNADVYHRSDLLKAFPHVFRLALPKCDKETPLVRHNKI